MTPERTFEELALEQALNELRDTAPEDAVVSAAAARVWAKLAAASEHAGDHLRNCADFQALLPELRAGTLSGPRAMLLRDHLHECVACRRVWEGRVTAMPAARTARATRFPIRWAAAAVVAAAAGLSIWVWRDHAGAGAARAIVQTVNGSLFEVTSAGIVPLVQGRDLPDDVEIRTAMDSSAVVALRDGSLVEVKEHSAFTTSTSGADLDVRLSAGSIIVQAAKRAAGHLYVDTAEYRVAVTGTIFGVSSGVKGSRVSVVQGEVHVIHDNQDQVLHPGQQAVSSADLEPETVRDDISWSRDRTRYFAILQQIREGISHLEMPDVRYASHLLSRLPASTAFYLAIPNLSEYLGNAESILKQKLVENPELRGVAGEPSHLAVMLEKLRTAGQYLGDEIVMAVPADAAGNMQPPLFYAEVRRDGFPQLLAAHGTHLAVEIRNGIAVIGADAALARQAADAPGGFEGTPFYARIAEAYREGAGLLICADLSRMSKQAPTLAGARYFIAQQRQVNHRTEARASLAFDTARTGAAAWLGAPAPMGSLDYVSPDATLVAAFIAHNPSSILDALSGIVNHKSSDLGESGNVLATALAGTLGGEFSFAVDGPLMPVPSWKLVAEVYDPAKFQAAILKGIETLNQAPGTTKTGDWHSSEETVDGRLYYAITSNGGPLMEAHYTFAGGYVVAGPTRALVARALQVKTSGANVKHSARFLSLLPRDRFSSFSAVFYENIGSTLAPFAGLMGAFGNGDAKHQRMLQGLGNMKPTLIAAYGEPDTLTIASADNVLGQGLTNLMTGNLAGLVGNVLPIGQFAGAHAGR